MGTNCMSESKSTSPVRLITTTTCLCLVIANMVGTGVFTSLGFQLNSLHSPFAILLLWGLGGILALTGAFSYAELALTLPRSGGEYHFLSKIYHPAIGFVAGITSVLVGFAAPIAISAIAFQHYLQGTFPGHEFPWAPLAVVLIITSIHSISLKVGSSFQVFFTTAKILLIVAFIVLSFILLDPIPVNFLPGKEDLAVVGSSGFAIGLMYVMYSYLGWNAAIYIVEEIRNPSRSIVIALTAGTLIVTILYTLLNYIFLKAAPAEALRGQIEIGQIVATHIFGENGGRIMSGLICLGLISSLSAMVWAGPRVLQVFGEDYRLLRPLGKRSAQGIPVRALWLQASLALGILLFAVFDQIILFTQFTLTLSTFLTVLGVILLRWKSPDLPRPFRCPLFPFTPLLFLLITGFTLIHVLIAKPFESLSGLAFLTLSLILFFIDKQLSRSKPA